MIPMLSSINRAFEHCGNCIQFFVRAVAVRAWTWSPGQKKDLSRHLKSGWFVLNETKKRKKCKKRKNIKKNGKNERMSKKKRENAKKPGKQYNKKGKLKTEKNGKKDNACQKKRMRRKKT